MAYKIGVSSGWWKIERPPELLGIPMKVGGFGATLGTDFIQVDLETTSEFYEPQLKERVMRLKKELGMEMGLHAEIGEMTSLESGERRIWEQSHIRLCETVKNAAELGMVFINMHMSHSLQMYQREPQLKPFGHTYQVVDPYGKPLKYLAESSPHAKAELMKHMTPRAGVYDEDVFEKKMGALKQEAGKNIESDFNNYLNSRDYKDIKTQYDAAVSSGRLSNELAQAELARIAGVEREKITYRWDRWLQQQQYNPEFLYEAWKESRFGQYFIEWGEIGAYFVVAAHMHGSGDPLWTAVCNGKDPTDAYSFNQPGFNAAVAMRYIEGHLTANNEINKKILGGKTILQWLNEKKLYLNFEIPEIDQPGMEGLSRLYNPLDFYHLVKKLGSPFVKICIDFEHMISNKMEPEKIISSAPGDFGKYVNLFHLGKPIPYFGTAHAQIPVPSRSMEILYKWLYMMRQKGFADGYMIYERGSGKNPQEVVQKSVLALRNIAENLGKGIAPVELPETFYGISEQNKDMFARQLTAVREHAWDPLTGLLVRPEETHTFRSRTAVEKGKAEEWKRARFR
ncbi:MAG: hypothetical protein HZB67_01445 [Candidatus Aenigmarchaeota archaeon]|nr:hypothetical protein [Candidatus Aenigmarchaeota archaeon]